MASIKKMNQTIAKWLYGDGKIREVKNEISDYWILTIEGKAFTTLDTDFDSNYNHLMKAFEKATSSGIELKYDDIKDRALWYSIYPEIEITNKREGVSKWKGKVGSFKCAFAANGFSKIGYGEKFNHEFEKPSIILAMHYSIYRLIKNGLEY